MPSIAIYYYSTMRLIFIYRPSEGGRLDAAVVFSLCPKLHVAVIFRINTETCSQRRIDAGLLAPQASVLSLDNCDPFNVEEISSALSIS